MALDTLPLLEKVGVITALDTRPLRDRGRGGHGPRHLPSSGKRGEVVMALDTCPLLANK